MGAQPMFASIPNCFRASGYHWPYNCRILPVLFAFLLFTARRLAKRGICRRRVSVCLSVCHTPVLYQNG